jgi:hypothetical protein
MNNIPLVNNTDYVLTADFVKLTLNLAAGGTEVVTFSTSYRNETFGGNEYTALAGLLGVGTQQRDLSATGFDTTVSFLGVDPANIFYVLSDEYKLKGSLMQIYRGFYNANYVLNPVLRYTGIVTSWSIEESLDLQNLSDTYVCSINCSNYKSVLANHMSGRNTSPTSWKNSYPLDVSMDNVPSLINATWDFGVPK